jgi:hypothetical protein
MPDPCDPNLLQVLFFVTVVYGTVFWFWGRAH